MVGSMVVPRLLWLTVAAALGCEDFSCDDAAVVLLQQRAQLQVQKAAPASHGDRRFNIVLLMTDSMDGRLLDEDAAEYRAVELPFLKETLTRKGAIFKTSYSNNPLCVPSRSSMMTGKTSDQLGVWGNDQGLAASPSGTLDDECIRHYGRKWCQKFAEKQGYPKTIMSAFTKLGYNVGAVGRLDIGGAYLNRKKHDGSIAYTWMHAGAWSSPTADDFLRLAGILVTGENASALAHATEDRDALADSRGYGPGDVLIRDRCLKFIEGLPEPHEQTAPFFLYCSFNMPHFPYEASKKWFELQTDDRVVMPTWLEGFPDAYHPHDVYKAFGDGIIGDYDPVAIRRLRKIYYAMCAEVDENLGLVWKALVGKGFNLDNTYVVYIADHGELAFEHRQMGKGSMYEGSVRVPLVVAGPGIQHGQKLEHLASLLDIFPTLLDMAHVSDPTVYEGLMGKSLLHAAGGHSIAPVDKALSRASDDRDFVYSFYNWDRANGGVYMVRSGKWKLMIYGKAFNTTKHYQPQLFDLATDPEELFNVACEHKHRVLKMAGQLKAVFDIDAVGMRLICKRRGKYTTGLVG